VYRCMEMPLRIQAKFGCLFLFVSTVLLCLAGVPSITCSQVTLAPGTGSGLPGSSDNKVDINLTNTGNKIKAVQMEVCDPEDHLTIADKGGCKTTSRASHFSCFASELDNGCARVVLISFQGFLIQEGTGPVCTLSYTVGEENWSDACTTLSINNENVSDQSGASLDVITADGEFCLSSYGDIYPQGVSPAGTACGDGTVNLLDVMEGADLVSGRRTANSCQQLHGDVPNGMPPFCGSPSDSSNCQTDGTFDTFDLLVIVDRALGKTNCCESCR